ncbi:MAG TPA: hypothetical protein PLP01_11670 [Phycisphaerae bacterium]|nr:hypothetical protein [Phycisphaerae bacterium]
MASGRIPILFIVDDPPVNTTYWLRRQPKEMGVATEPRGSFGRYVADWRRQEPGKLIPNAFWRKFIDWARGCGVRGKFTLLPCPAGLGFIDDQVEGYSDGELSELVGMVREEYTRQFSVTPEILTHTMAWDLKRKMLLPETEHDWMGRQDEPTLTAYMAEALRVLKRVGIEAPGITQPCNFRGDEDLYARAVLAAEKEVNGISRTFYFLHCDGESHSVASTVKLADPASGDYVVSVVSAIRPDEPFWQSLYGDGDVEEMADYFITADGSRGRFIDLAATGSALVFHGHSQTLFSNGTEKGFQSLQLVVSRVEKHLGDRVRWVTAREFCEEVIAASA